MRESDNNETFLQRDLRKLLLSFLVPGALVLLMTLVFITGLLFDANLASLGIYPNNIKGLPGIITAPFIHADARHLFNNSVPILFLGTTIFYFYPRVAFRIFFGVYLLSGFWVWLVAREAWHIGASGLVYGFASFVFFSGVVRRYMPLLALSMLVVFLYGSMVWGLFPHFLKDISWEGHMFGAIAGLIFALVYINEGPVIKEPEWLDEEDEEEVIYEEVTDEDES